MNIRQQMEIINTCNCRITELYGEWAKQHGMSYHAMITLYALNQDRKCTQKQIAAEWLIPKQTVNTVVKELERQGYVFFQTGKKEKQVRFTEAGRAFAGPCLQELYEIEDRAVAAMGEARFREMVEANRAFTEAFAREVQHG